MADFKSAYTQPRAYQTENYEEIEGYVAQALLSAHNLGLGYKEAELVLKGLELALGGFTPASCIYDIREALLTGVIFADGKVYNHKK